MCIYRLPDDILFLILQRTLVSTGNAEEALRTNLPLLAVCRRWRRVGLPIAYKRVLLQHCAARPRGAAGPRDTLGLILAVGCLGLVREVVLEVQHAASPLRCLDSVVQAMRAAAAAAAAGTWAAVRTLSVSLCLVSDLSITTTAAVNPDAGGDEREGGGEGGDDVGRVAAALAAVLPGVHRVEFGWAARSETTRQLYGRLAGMYAAQLREIESRHPIAIPADCAFARLRAMHLACKSGAAGYRLPRTSTAALVSLKLTGWPAAWSWAPFAAEDTTPGVIVFPCLRVLEIACDEYSAAAVDDVQQMQQQQWGFCFPRLETARVHCVQGAQLVLRHAALPRQMDEIAIHVPAQMVRGVAEEMALPATRRLVIGITGGAAGDQGVLAAADRILGEGAARETGLLVCDSTLRVVPEALTCTALTELTVDAATSVAAMVALMRRLPRLVELKLWALTLDDAHRVLAVPEPAGVLVDPLGPRLRTIVVSAARDDWPQETAILVVQYLLLVAPSLTRLVSFDAPETPVREFVAAYGAWYPHLTGVSLSLLGEC